MRPMGRHEGRTHDLSWFARRPHRKRPVNSICWSFVFKRSIRSSGGWGLFRPKCEEVPAGHDQHVVMSAPACELNYLTVPLVAFFRTMPGARNSEQ